jgi:hypothetical protein
MGIYNHEYFDYRMIIKNRCGESTIILLAGNKIDNRVKKSLYYSRINTEERQRLAASCTRIWHKRIDDAIDISLSAEERDYIDKMIWINRNDLLWHGFMDHNIIWSTYGAGWDYPYPQKRILESDNNKIYLLTYN